jgi:hypothetical protein
MCEEGERAGGKGTRMSWRWWYPLASKLTTQLERQRSFRLQPNVVWVVDVLRVVKLQRSLRD